MSHSRFYIPESDWNPEALVLVDDEAHHCRDVMRLEPGSRLTVFNGAGKEAETEISAASRDRIELRPLVFNESAPLPARITLGQAIPKGKNMDLIVQKATELGAAEIIPLLSERTIVQIDPIDLEKKRQKWQRVAIEACKQCGQNWLPTVGEPISVDRFVEAKRPGVQVIGAIEPSARPFDAILADYLETNPERPDSATVMVGPEGDFTPAEMAKAFSAGFAPWSLGPIVLRSETAAIYTLSVLAYELMR
ncbi:MAG: 16S rRNA (uracil(1498)-N(3))-methyltransferase [Verrucomicrobiota bacterium]